MMQPVAVLRLAQGHCHPLVSGALCMSSSELSRPYRHGSVGLETEDFEAIEQAVLETARGRWFLDQYASRLRAAETARLLAGIERLETALAASHDALMDRLAGAPGSKQDTGPDDFPAAQDTAHLEPRHMRYFRDDEALFEEAPRGFASVTGLTDFAEEIEAEREAARRSRIVIIRHKPGEEIDVPLASEMAGSS